MERRIQYAQSKKLREQARVRARKYRARRRADPSITRKLYRTVDGKRCRVFTTGQVANYLGSSPQMIRNWEDRGWIPPSVFPDKHRLYMQHQVKLLQTLRDSLRDAGGRSGNVVKFNDLLDHIAANW